VNTEHDRYDCEACDGTGHRDGCEAREPAWDLGDLICRSPCDGCCPNGHVSEGLQALQDRTARRVRDLVDPGRQWAALEGDVQHFQAVIERICAEQPEHADHYIRRVDKDTLGYIVACRCGSVFRIEGAVALDADALYQTLDGMPVCERHATELKLKVKPIPKSPYHTLGSAHGCTICQTPPAENRTCGYCHQPLHPQWPAVYCSNVCAWKDA